MVESLRHALSTRVVVADGGMGTMLQRFDLTLDDFDQLEGCNEILNLTRPDVVAEIHAAYLEAGSDAVETNTFGANLAALGEYGIADRVHELALAGARIAREVADRFAADGRPRYVLGSLGPGTKLPSLGHVSFAALRDGYQDAARGLIEGGVDGFQIETCQDLLQAKAAVIGTRRALAEAGVDLPIIVSVTVETTGTMLLGSEIGAALVALEPLGIDLIGLNCATGPAEMREHLRYLSRHACCGLSVMPNAGLPVLGKDGASYPLTPIELADALDEYTQEFGVALVGGCCGTTPDHIAAVCERVRGRAVTPRTPERAASVSSLYTDERLRQDTSYLAIGERTNANGSKAFREAMLAGQWDACVDIAKRQSREGAHLIDLCADYVGRDGRSDMRELAFRLNTAVPLPVMLDSTEPEVIRAGLESLAGRSIINSVNFEDGDGPASRFARVMPMVKEHGAVVVALTIDEEGQARTADWKVRVAERLIDTLTTTWGMDESDIIVDCLTFPIGTGQEETRRDALETIEAISRISASHPDVSTTLGVSNVSFGLNPAARVVLNSVFLHECVEAGLTSAIVHPSKIVPMARIDDEQRQVALDLVYDRRREGYDPLARYLELFEGVTVTATKEARAAELAALPLPERLRRRIVDADDQGLTDDLDAALQTKDALAIINDDLLAGMQTVGDLFGSGQMQLPFVLASAEIMKKSVAYLEPHMEASEASNKGTIVLATVKGDVHDIGKNLVDIIMSNNGYTVVNLGIKQPIADIIAAAEEHDADAIGMSGLLVKSTVVMRDNLDELNARGLSSYPVLLGGAALTRTYVEHDLNDLYEGEVRYAKDAFEGLALMDAIMAVKRGVPGASLPEPRQRRLPAGAERPEPTDADTIRSDVERGRPSLTPPFWGSRVVKGIQLGEIVDWLDEDATLKGRWGLRAQAGRTYEEVAQTEGRPRLRALLDTVRSERLGEFAVVYGYWPVYSEGRSLVVLDPDSVEADGVRLPADGWREIERFEFPRQVAGRRLAIPDFFRDRAEAEASGPDVLPLQLVTMGSRVSEATAELFGSDAYRAYLELHGLSVQLTEALAEMWHARVRAELGIDGDDGDLTGVLNHQDYCGSRYSFGYGACPDLEQRAIVVRLLGADRIGVQLSEEFQLAPEQSTDALVVPHPEAKYFNAR